MCYNWVPHIVVLYHLTIAVSRFKYKFTLHQVYAYYSQAGNLNWREVAEMARVSTRTLRAYFENSDSLAKLLVDYHLKYLENYYEKFRIDPRKYDEFPSRLIFTVMLKHKVCYLFTDKAVKNNLAGRGQEIKESHLDLIGKAMSNGGVSDPKKIDPELTFNNLILPLENSENGEEFFNHMMKWFLK